MQRGSSQTCNASHTRIWAWTGSGGNGGGGGKSSKGPVVDGGGGGNGGGAGPPVRNAEPKAGTYQKKKQQGIGINGIPKKTSKDLRINFYPSSNLELEAAVAAAPG